MLPVLRLVYGIGILDSLAVQEKFLFIRKEYKTGRRRKAIQFLDSPYRGIPINGIVLGLFQIRGSGKNRLHKRPENKQKHIQVN